jgi:hypothetical protein
MRQSKFIWAEWRSSAWLEGIAEEATPVEAPTTLARLRLNRKITLARASMPNACIRNKERRSDLVRFTFALPHMEGIGPTLARTASRNVQQERRKRSAPVQDASSAAQIIQPSQER